MPTLVLHGESDPVVPVLNARYMAARIPAARWRLIPPSGHLILLDEAAVSRALIPGFLDGRLD